MVRWKIAQSKAKGCSTNRIVRVDLAEKQMFKQRLGGSWGGMPGKEERSWGSRVPGALEQGQGSLCLGPSKTEPGLSLNFSK